MTTRAAGDETLLVHNWRVARLTQLGIPRALAEVYADRLDWHQVARLIQHGCPRRWPCASPADERTREVALYGTNVPGYLGPTVLVSLIAGGDDRPQTHAASGQRRVQCASPASERPRMAAR